MANKKFKISTNRLGRDSEQIIRLIQNMEKEINNMQTSVGQMNTMWEGVSKQAFVQAFTDDMRAASDVLKELKALYNYEVQAKNSYEHCENQVGGLIANMRV